MQKIFLTGLRGSGKSTVGKELAEMLKCKFIDLDIYLMTRKGKSIAEIVAQDGWPAFRRLEKECLKEVCSGLEEGGIIATGGGIVLDPENRAFMRENGFVFWLAAHPEVLSRRLEANPDIAQRPALSQKELLAEMRDLAWERFPHYADAAHCIIDGEGPSKEICCLIRELIPHSGQDT